MNHLEPTNLLRSTNPLSPFQVTRRDLNYLFRSPRLVRRMEAAGWFELVRQGKAGREALFDFASVQKAYERLRRGEEPPMLPYEQRPVSTGGTK